MRRPVRSAGGIVLKSAGDRLLGLFVGSGKHGEWQIPKGMLEAGESSLTAAVREVREETGVAASVARYVLSGEWDYEYGGEPWHETCDFFVLFPLGDAVAEHDDEFAEVNWFDLGEVGDGMRYEIESTVVSNVAEMASELFASEGLVIAKGVGLSGNSVRGRLVWSDAGVSRWASTGGDIVLLRETFEPSDAQLLARAVGIVADRGGVASHLAVVAAVLNKGAICGVPHVIDDGFAYVGNGVLWEGATVVVDPRAGTIALAEPDERDGAGAERNDRGRVAFSETLASGDAAGAQGLALEWANTVAARAGLGAVLNWKFFKRRLLELFFPSPPALRFFGHWHPSSVASAVLSLGGRGVRLSVFPDRIACHAKSILLPDGAGEEAVLNVLATLDRAVAIEVFVQQGFENLAWRMIAAGEVVGAEAGIGQAMNLFEEERGFHPLVSAHVRPSSGCEWEVGDGEATSRQVLSEFLGLYGSEVLASIAALRDFLAEDTVAIEGYYDRESRTWLACDLDLPYDAAFMLPTK